MVWLQAALVATAVSGGGETVLLDFYADWCGPCRAMNPTIEALIQEGHPVRKVNIDRNPQLAGKHRVGSVPCYVMLVDGREVDRVVGGTSFSRLKRMFQLVPPRETATRQPPPAPERRPAAPVGTARNEAADRLDAKLIAASVRLRIEDPEGHSCGSGTIIDARQGEALILTCGHIFRDSQGKGRIEVDLFGPEGVQRVAGNLISYDLKRDVGLLSIRTPGPVATARVAPPGHQVSTGSQVVSVGCNNGDRPTARHSRVTSLDKYLGPANLQVTGLPVEGRSGGGLFSAEGQVVGVCNAADPSDQEGLYAALATIHAELDQSQLSFVYNPGDQRSATEPKDSAPTKELATVDPSPALPKQFPVGPATQVLDESIQKALEPIRRSSETQPSTTAATAQPLDPSEQAALDEIRRRLQEGAEVICVVRSRRDPAAKSEVIILDKVSANFLRQLSAEVRPQGPLRSTSLEIPRKRQPAGGQFRPETSRIPVGSGSAAGRRSASPHPGNTAGWRSR